MTGTSYSYFGDSGVLEIDALVGHTRWTATPATDIITYAFPTAASQYGSASAYQAVALDNYLSTFAQINQTQKDMALSILEQSDGNTANNGFTVEGLTNLQLQQASNPSTANIRYAISSIPSNDGHSAVGFLPFDEVCAGDIWIDDEYAITPKIGNFGGYTFLHETGHALGLKHPWTAANDSFSTLPRAQDTIENTVMSYNALDNVGGTGSVATWSFPQTFMRYDIQALQYMYGADYSTQNGDTVYSWEQGSGDTWVNGVKGIDAGGSVIFATIWDGGGIDVYDLSTFTSDVTIRLAPGSASVFNTAQLASLMPGRSAEGNIYNAYLYQNNTASMIENAIGGSGNDTLIGNTINNSLTGNNGSDTLSGWAGNDTLAGGANTDYIYGGEGDDYLNGSSGNDILKGNNGNDDIRGFTGANILTGGAGDDKFWFVASAGLTTTVEDFENGVDVLSLYQMGFSSFADVQAHATGGSYSYNGETINKVDILADDGTRIRLNNFTLSQLTADDFYAIS